MNPTLRNYSLGRYLLPKGLYERLQFDRYPISQFILNNALPLLSKDVLVLDAGSGGMEEQHTRARVLATGAKIHAVDISSGTGLDFISDLEQLAVRDGTYDVILCTQVLEHVKHPQKVAVELHRVLKPNGHLFVTVPQSAFLHDLPHHYFNYTSYGIHLLLEEAGFRILALEPQGGHFYCLGVQLHYNTVVIREGMTSPLGKIFLFPLLLACQAVFGFLTKLLFIWLDRFDHTWANTQGWNCHCRKPAGATEDS